MRANTAEELFGQDSKGTHSVWIRVGSDFDIAAEVFLKCRYNMAGDCEESNEAVQYAD